MISKLKYSFLGVIMLVLLGFGFQNSAKAAVGPQWCPGVTVPNGWLQSTVTPLVPAPNFSGALIGTIESEKGINIGEMDWQHGFDPNAFNNVQLGPGSNFTNIFKAFDVFEFTHPSNITGAQLVSWWTEQPGRDTFIQLTNGSGDSTDVHVVILDENCVEIRDFCDSYTAWDTHVYDFADLATNDGQTPDDTVLKGHEGFVTLTAVDDCTDKQAIDFNFLAGNTYITDVKNGIEYGMNTFARFGVCFPEVENLITNGSFQDGVLPPWDERQGASRLAGVIDANGISPAVPPPPCSDPLDPDCQAANADKFQAFVASDPGVAPGNNPSPQYQFPDGILVPSVIGVGTETNVTILSSNSFSTDGNFSSHVEYDIQVLDPTTTLGCANYTAVCVINTFNTPDSFEDCNCYNATGTGSINTSRGTKNCVKVAGDNITYAIGATSFGGGKGSVIHDSLSVDTDLDTQQVDVFTGQIATGNCFTSTINPVNNPANGALVDNFELIELVSANCDPPFSSLDGVNSFFFDYTPQFFAGQFNVLPISTSVGADVVNINFQDNYGSSSPHPYTPLAANVNLASSVYDLAEGNQSCGSQNICFSRLGIDASVPNSDDFSPSTPTPTIGPSTPPPTIRPSIPTLQPSFSSSNSGGCAIAGNPVQVGTAFANLLIPLAPVAFAFGVRAVRKRKK